MQRILIFFAATIFSACFSSMLQAQALVPVGPAELLKCLPSPQTGWKMSVSTALHLRQNPPQSIATREYILPADLSANPSGTNQVRLRMVLHDTAGDVDLVKQYDQQAATVAHSQLFNLDGMSAVRIEYPGESGHVEALIYDRFILKLILFGPAKDKPENFFKSINLAELKQLAAKRESIDLSKTYEFNMQVVDELNPNRTTTVKFEIAGTVRDGGNTRHTAR